MAHIDYLKNVLLQIKAKTLKQLKVLKDSKFIDNKLYYYYVKATNSPAPTIMDKLFVTK